MDSFEPESLRHKLLMSRLEFVQQICQIKRFGAQFSCRDAAIPQRVDGSFMGGGEARFVAGIVYVTCMREDLTYKNCIC